MAAQCTLNIAVGPYREAHGCEVVEAPTRQGVARLQLGPTTAIIDVGEHHRLSVSRADVTIAALDRRKPKQRSFPLQNAHLILARANPTEDIGLWYEGKPGMVQRLFGLQPLQLLDAAALTAWRALDQLASRLSGALTHHRGDVIRAWEFGRGQDRVLMTDTGSCYTIYVRRLFRERPRRALEVHTSGKLVFVQRHGEREAACHSRFGVTVLGDRVRFAAPDGTDIGSIWLPWIAPEDRDELARIFGQRIDHSDAESSYQSSVVSRQ